MGAVFFLPGQQSHFMKGAFLSTPASRIAAPFFCNTQGGLNKGPYPSEALQSALSPLIGHQRTRHLCKYIYFPTKCQEKNAHCEKIFSVSGLKEKKSRTEAG
jgi:hypothetical protein